MKYAAGTLAVLFLALSGCERQIPILQNQRTNGYEIRGTVTDRIGNPIPGVNVSVDFFWDLVYTDSAATRTYVVADSTVPIQALVVDWSNSVVRVLTQPQRRYGPYEILWDGTDSVGFTMPSGIYYVEYVAGGTTRFSYSQLVGGGVVATTDKGGKYVIPLHNLPIDSATVPYFNASDGSYIGTIIVLNDVLLSFGYPPRMQNLELTLNKNLVTIVDLKF